MNRDCRKETTKTLLLCVRHICKAAFYVASLVTEPGTPGDDLCIVTTNANPSGSVGNNVNNRLEHSQRVYASVRGTHMCGCGRQALVCACF